MTSTRASTSPATSARVSIIRVRWKYRSPDRRWCGSTGGSRAHRSSARRLGSRRRVGTPTPEEARSIGRDHDEDALPRQRGDVLVPTLVFFGALAVSMGGLAYAMRDLPVGTSYAVWVGIGATLTVVYAMATGDETGLTAEDRLPRRDHRLGHRPEAGPLINCVRLAAPSWRASDRTRVGTPRGRGDARPAP